MTPWSIQSHQLGHDWVLFKDNMSSFTHRMKWNELDTDQYFVSVENPVLKLKLHLPPELKCENVYSSQVFIIHKGINGKWKWKGKI